MPSNPPLQHARHRVAVLISGHRVDAAAVRHDSDRYQDLLIEAKSRFGHALCECGPKPLHLVIRERNGKLFLACWPDQSHLHALDCPFYRGHDESSRTKYPSEAIDDDGLAFRLRLHRPVTRRSGENLAVRQKTEALHIWGLLHHLWESGGLNRWHPGWTRDWGRVRWLLRRVAQSTYLDGGDKALLQRFYVPPIWTPKRKESIDADWLAFKRPLVAQNRSSPVVACGFVIGMVRSLEPSTHGYSIRLQHHAERFYLDQQVASMLAGYSRRGWSALRVPPNDHPTSRVLAAIRVQATGSGTLVVVEGALMLLSRDFIPVANGFEDIVARELVSNSRAFIKPLHYDHHRDRLPHFILTDCANGSSEQDRPDRTCLFVYGNNIEPNRLHQLLQDDEAVAKGLGMAAWKWLASEAELPPPFPPQWLKPDGLISNSVHKEK